MQFGRIVCQLPGLGLGAGLGWWAAEHASSTVVSAWAPGGGEQRRAGPLAVRTLGSAEPVVLLLHGMIAAGNSFGATYDDLAEVATLVVPDLLGFGGSMLTSGPIDSAAHVRALDEALCDLGLAERPTVVVGHSMGGGLALRWVHRSEGMDMGGMDMGGSPASEELGGGAGDVVYPYYLVNGRIGTAPQAIDALPGQRLRLRLINAGGDTAFRVAIGGHQLTVTHTDGFPVQAFTGDAVLIGMGERVDVLVTLGDGVFPLVSVAEGKDGAGLALIRTGVGAAPGPDIRPPELAGRIVTVRDLMAADDVLITERRPDRTHELVLEGGMGGYEWTINGNTFDRADPLPVRAGETVRLRFTNRSMMFHPMHVHGHTFQVRNDQGDGPRKDTVIVRPMEIVVADLVEDNPGQWLTHCHNIYHAEAGMMTTLSYVK